MLDARLGDAMADAIRALPPRSAVIVRPRAMGCSHADIRHLCRIAAARRHQLWLADVGPLRGYAGRHNNRHVRPRKGERATMAVHDRRQADQAARLGVEAAIISPVHPTRSHSEARPLGARGFARLAARLNVPAIALGGMTAARFARLRQHGADGWAAIDAWQEMAARRRQKRNSVPT